ncbi:energy transducer TonB [Spirosoma aerophilum]
MKIFLSTLLLLATTLFLPEKSAMAQSQKVYTVVEHQPEYPGGQAALSRFLADNIKVPGSLGRKIYIMGPISAKFIIDELGYVHDVRITTKPFDQKAQDKKTQKEIQSFMTNIILAVEKMPRWEPGEVDGKRVPVFYTMPIEVNMQ